MTKDPKKRALLNLINSLPEAILEKIVDGLIIDPYIQKHGLAQGAPHIPPLDGIAITQPEAPATSPHRRIELQLGRTIRDSYIVIPFERIESPMLLLILNNPIVDGDAHVVRVPAYSNRWLARKIGGNRII